MMVLGLVKHGKKSYETQVKYTPEKVKLNFPNKPLFGGRGLPADHIQHCKK